jgi:hypothetical protein
VVDVAGGYFYAIYGSRVISKPPGGWWTTYYTHAARAPMSGKFTGWQKWYDGKWSEPGLGGKESSIYPVSALNPTGYTAPEKEYNPKNNGTSDWQIAHGLMPPTTPLFWMDVSYNAHTGRWIGEPSNLDQSGHALREFYACTDLATQKWELIGDHCIKLPLAHRQCQPYVEYHCRPRLPRLLLVRVPQRCVHHEFVHLSIDGPVRPGCQCHRHCEAVLPRGIC